MKNPIPRPIEFRRQGEQGLAITWAKRTDELSEPQIISSSVLRSECPCAGCREQRGDQSHAKPLTTPVTSKPSMLKIVTSSSNEEQRLLRIWPIGNYALGIEWGDGHNTGIYTYELLARLGEDFGSSAPRV